LAGYPPSDLQPARSSGRVFSLTATHPRAPERECRPIRNFRLGPSRAGLHVQVGKCIIMAKQIGRAPLRFAREHAAVANLDGFVQPHWMGCGLRPGPPGSQTNSDGFCVSGTFILVRTLHDRLRRVPAFPSVSARWNDPPTLLLHCRLRVRVIAVPPTMGEPRGTLLPNTMRMPAPMTKTMKSASLNLNRVG
jgi:hypothetical protein